MSADSPSGRLYLIDAHSLIFQVFHAIPEMSSPTGLPTNAVFGFTKDLLFLRSLKPDYLICCFDPPGPTFRDAIYPEYKAHRSPMPDDLRLQIPKIHEIVEAMGIPIVVKERYEADDVIATLSKAGAARGLDVFVCTSDKDCRQLIDDRIRLYSIRKRAEFGTAELLADWGIRPDQVVDLQTLVGDSVDNVKGVPGIGVKTAAKLLQEFGTLENLLANLDKVPGKKQENLKASKEIVALSRQLVKLPTDVDIPMNWDDWKLGTWKAEQLLELFRDCGFRTFADQVRQESEDRGQRAEVGGQKSDVGAETAERKSVQGDLFAFGGAREENGQAVSAPEMPTATAKAWVATYRLVNTPAQFEAFLKHLKKQKRFAFDTETTGLQPLLTDIVGIAFCWQSGEASYLAVRGPEGEPVLDPAVTLAALRPIFENPKAAKINQNVKYDLLVLRAHGINVQGVVGDSMVADYLLHSGERGHGMDEMSRRYLDHSPIPITDLIGKRGKNQLRMDQVPLAKIAEYSAEDANVAWRLCEKLEPELESIGFKRKSAAQDGTSLYDDVEIPLIDVLTELEFNGIRLDIPRLQRMSEEMAQQLHALELEIYNLAGREFNIASLPQLRKVLFDELKLPVQRKTGVTGEASTDSETLERLAALGHEIPRKILAQRQISKLKGTYVDAFPTMVSPKTGRIHASFNQTVAATGRLSSSDPNLQNIPIRSELGGQIRQAFVPAEGWGLLTADYSQVELRLLAHFCGDAVLRQAFAEDRDIHSVVAAKIYGVEEKDVTAEMRRMAKTVNFGVIYGMSAHGLAQRLGIPLDDAGKFIDAYFARYPMVLDYQGKLLRDCAKNRYVSTILGRRREITGVRTNSTYQQRNQPEREAINMQIQGSAADLIKLAMLNIHRRLHEEKRQSRMLLQIHDELVFETPPEELGTVAKLVREEMTAALKLEVPLQVEVATGANWLDVETIHQ